MGAHIYLVKLSAQKQIYLFMNTVLKMPLFFCTQNPVWGGQQCLPSSVIRWCSLNIFIPCVYALQTHFKHVMRLHASCSPLAPCTVQMAVLRINLLYCSLFGFWLCKGLHSRTALQTESVVSSLAFLGCLTTSVSGALIQRYPCA